MAAIVRDAVAAELDVPDAKRSTARDTRSHRYFYGRGSKPCAHDNTATTEGGLYSMSNFFKAGFHYRGKQYDSVEHYYQAKKFLPHSPEYAEKVRAANSPRAAKALCYAKNAPPIRGDWDVKRVKVMRRGVYEKFSQNSELKKCLLDTGDDVLHEDAPTDPFWGVCGKDMLGKILCEVRAQLRSEAKK